MARKRQCTCCTTMYEYCGRCEKYWYLPSWMEMFCSENCKNIWHIAADYKSNKIDKETAMRLLQDYDYSDLNKFQPSVRDAILEITVKPASNVAEEVKKDEEVQGTNTVQENRAVQVNQEVKTVQANNPSRMKGFQKKKSKNKYRNMNSDLKVGHVTV